MNASERRRGRAARPRAAAALFALLAGLPACGGDELVPAARPQAVDPHHATLQVEGRTVSVELATDDLQRMRGLKHRTSLAPDSGMLFVFPDEAPRTFWMHDTLIPLDIVFLDAGGEVINIEHGRPGVERPGYMSRRPARFVLEMAGGWCAEAGLEPGDRIEIPAEVAARGR